MIVDSTAPGVFRVGQHVALLRDLPSLRLNSEGAVRGVTASASGISYVVRFARLTRVVAERNLAAAPLPLADGPGAGGS